MLNPNDIDILQHIVDTDGKCLDYKKCQLCPFKRQCLIEYLRPTQTPAQTKKNLALNILSHVALIGEDVQIEDYVWGNNQ